MNDQPILSAGPSDMPVDMTRVDRMAATIQRRHTIWTRGKSVALAALGIGAGVGLAYFLIQPKIVKVPELVEVPTVYETTKVVEKPVIVETTRVVEKPVYIDKPIHDGGVETPKPPPETSLPQHAPVARKWDQLTDKRYVGVLTDLVGDHICFDHNLSHCTWVAVTDANGRAVLGPDGQPIIDHDVDAEPMRKWIGSSVYTASDPHDPAHLTDYWVADNGSLIQFNWDRRNHPPSHSDSIALKSDDGGQSLQLDVGLGARTYTYVLDTGASNMTVTKAVADQLVSEGHATRGESTPVTLADGSHRTEPTVVIDKVTLGAHTVDNVVAFVTPDSGMPLLGMNVLNRIGQFTVDAPHLTLTFNGAPS